MIERKKFFTTFCILLLVGFAATAQSNREVIGLQDGWKFHLGGTEYADNPDFNDAAWEKITLPHTWNAKDPFDDNETYFRGIGWYRKTVKFDKNLEGKEINLYFEGAYQVVDVYVDGAFAGQHKGGFTAFSVDITHFINWKTTGATTIAIQVNSAHDNFIIPLSVGYALYGGIYRNVWVVATDKLHFGGVEKGQAGVAVQTKNVETKSPTIYSQTTIKNKSAGKRRFTFSNKLTDAANNVVVDYKQEIEINGGEERILQGESGAVNNPKLWSPENPYLYKLTSQIIENGKVVDEVVNPVGFRWFRFSPDSGFFLNGKKYVLHGTNRHQDLQGKGSALSFEDHVRDIKLIKNMGANFLRLAHYPQAPDVLRLADEYGLLIWEEIPMVNYMNIDPEFLRNAKHMLTEMIDQHRNHPSIIMWGSMNEIFLHGKEGDRIQRQDDSLYVTKIKEYAESMDSLVRALDPSRYSTMAIHGSGDYAKYKLDNISQVTGHNNYSGWYGGKLEDFGGYLDRIHKESPKQNIFVSEYGAGSDRRLNSENPQRLDFTSTYQRMYHESYLRQLKSLPYLAGTAIWNQFDFSQPNIGGSISNENQKGMLTWDRQYKDVYFAYKANWNPDPIVYIASRDWAHRAGFSGEKHTVDIYANGKEVELYVNGIRIGKEKTDEINKVSFQVVLMEGENKLEAVTKVNGVSVKDEMTIHYTAYPKSFSDDGSSFQALYINAGSNAQYTDYTGTVWLQDRPYSKGSFGYVGGVPTTLNLKYMVKGTDHTPMYYSYLDNVKEYKLDVPDGTYELTLYTLETEKIKTGERVFDVMVNQNLVEKDMDLTASVGFCQADQKQVLVKVQDGKGIDISWVAKKGNAVLNGISVVKK